ncbi:MAG TPA: response regulator, partial [Bacteroidetes bacterium]|nr:response regulator [Bacteroidota bacterium]
RTRELSRTLEDVDDSATSRIASGESRFRDLAAVVPVGIFETDTEKKLVYVNKLLGRMTGMGARRTRINGFRSAIHDEDQEEVEQLWEDALEKRTVFEHVFRFQPDDGEVIWVVCLSHPRFVNGEYAGHVGMFMDVTERKRQDEERKLLEEQTRRADRYESLGVFAAGCAHDYNNLLVPMLGGADRLLAELEESTLAHSLAVKLHQAALKAADLTAELLACTGTMLTDPEYLNTCQFVEGLCPTIEAAKPRRATISLLCEGNRENTFLANPAQLRQAVMNLVTNAFEAVGDEPGHVIIRSGERHFSAEDIMGLHHGEGLSAGVLPFIEVEDDGLGIPEDQLERVFDPFYSSKSAGRGLGLAVVSGIIKSMGAGIRFSSDEHKGSRVTLIFARSQSESSTPSEPTRPRDITSEKDGSILIIDDEDGVREFVSTLLEANGIPALTAADGISGLKLFQRERSQIDGVILDLTMPRMDGEEVLQYLLEIDPNLPVLITSGYAESDVMERLKNHRVAGYLAKPFREQELLEGVAKLTSSQ